MPWASHHLPIPQRTHEGTFRSSCRLHRFQRLCISPCACLAAMESKPCRAGQRLWRAVGHRVSLTSLSTPLIWFLSALKNLITLSNVISTSLRRSLVEKRHVALFKRIPATTTAHHILRDLSAGHFIASNDEWFERRECQAWILGAFKSSGRMNFVFRRVHAFGEFCEFARPSLSWARHG